jgi:hypothetical protein
MQIRIKADFSQVKSATNAVAKTLKNMNPLSDQQSRLRTQYLWKDRIAIQELNADLVKFNPASSVEVPPQLADSLKLFETYMEAHPEMVEADAYYGNILDFSQPELDAMFYGYLERLINLSDS